MQIKPRPIHYLQKLGFRRRSLIHSLLVIGNISFMVFTYATVAYALHDVFGDLRFWGIRWASILTFNFSGIEYAGLARLLTPDSEDPPSETKYLLMAWILVTIFNSLLIWWTIHIGFTDPQNPYYADIPSVSPNIVAIIIVLLVWIIKIGLMKILTMNIGSKIEENDDVTTKLSFL